MWGLEGGDVSIKCIEAKVGISSKDGQGLAEMEVIRRVERGPDMVDDLLNVESRVGGDNMG